MLLQHVYGNLLNSERGCSAVLPLEVSELFLFCSCNAFLMMLMLLLLVMMIFHHFVCCAAHTDNFPAYEIARVHFNFMFSCMKSMLLLLLLLSAFF